MAHGIPARLTPRQGRKFGFTVGVSFLVLAAVMRWRDYAVPMAILGGLGIGLIAAGTAIPSRLGPVFRAWMGLASAISKVTTPILMGIAFFGVLMPVGLLMRLLGRNPVRHSPLNQSYWRDRSEGRGGMTNQF